MYYVNDFNFNINILSVTHFISWRCSYWRPKEHWLCPWMTANWIY